MSKFKITRPRYALVGADYSQLEVKTSVYTSKDAQMKQAYAEGKDLYSLIASMAYSIPYEDCLEFYPEGTVLSIEGQDIVCGNDKERIIDYDTLKELFSIPYYYLVPTTNGVKTASDLQVGDALKLTGYEYSASKILSIKRVDDVMQVHIEPVEPIPRITIRSPSKVTNKQGKMRRQSSKSLLIGSIYQRGIPSIAEQLHISVEEAQALMNSFYSGFPTMTQWMEDCKQFCKDHGYVESAVGRRRRLPDAQLPEYTIDVAESKRAEDFNPLLECRNRDNSDLLQKYKRKAGEIRSRKDFNTLKAAALEEGVTITSNSGKIQQALRQSVNSPCQSLGADVAKRLMLKVDQDELLNRLGFRLLIQVHDEVIGECPEANAPEVADRLVELMALAPAEMGIDIPMKSDAYIVHNWYEDELLTSVKAIAMENGDKSHEDIMNIICKAHTELLPSQIERVLLDPNATLFD